MKLMRDRSVIVFPASVLVGAFLLITAGCAPDHRISLQQFLQAQQTAAVLSSLEAAPDEPVSLELESHLGPYQVGPSDVLLVTFTRADQVGLFPPVQVRVDRNGEVDLPIVGAVRINGLELEDVEDRIRAAYIPGVVTEGVVHVQLVIPDSTNVLVIGAVAAPGLVQLRRTERNMLFALVAAGGVSSLASGTATVRRIRQPEVVETFNLTDPIQLKASLNIPPLQNGDIVYVDAAEQNAVYVGGLVTRTGPQPYPPGTGPTLLQAIAAAGGLRTDVSPREGTLIRRMPDGRDVFVKLDMNRLAMGQDPNIELQGGDILWVPETVGTRIQDFINRNIYMRAGISVNYSVSGTEFMNRRGTQSGAGRNLQDSFDPFGFLNQNSALQSIQSRP